MPILHMAGLPAHDGSGGLEVHGGREWAAKEPTSHREAHDPTQVPTPTHQQGGLQRHSRESVLLGMSEGDPSDRARAACSQEEGHQVRINEHVNSDGPGRSGTVSPVPPLAAGSERLRRKVKHSLKKAISFWKTIQELFSSHGVDDDTITKKLQSLHEEIVSDLRTCPKGSKRVQQIAEAMHLTTKNLKTVAEIYNPGCFTKLAKQHGLEPGLSFDITLGFDLLCHKKRAHVREYVRTVRPGLILLAPPCHMYSQLQNLLKDLRERDQVAMSKYLRKKKRAHTLLSFAVEIAETCRELGLSFVLEHPWSAESWQTKILKQLIQHEDVYLSRTDQCLFGLKGASGVLHRKRTGLLPITKVLPKHSIDIAQDNINMSISSANEIAQITTIPRRSSSCSFTCIS